VFEVTRYAQSGDASIAYQVGGDGPVTILISSYGTISVDSFGNDPHFARFLDGLTSFARVVRYDRRGVGLSDPIDTSDPPTLEQDVDDALAVLDHAGVEQAALFGAVMNGMATMLFAASHPERVGALLLVNTFARAERAPDYPFGFPSEILRSFHTEVTQPDSPLDTVELLELMSPSVAHDEQFVRWWEDEGRRGASPATARALWSVGFFADVRDVLPTIAVPTLVIHRRDSTWFRIGHGRYLGEHIPGAKYVEIAGSDSTPFTENADVVLDEVEEFLTGQRHDRLGDRVLATIVFTDIVRSTEQAAEMGDQNWRALLDRHDALVRRQLVRFGGEEVKTTGDGFLASFDGPARAIRFAVAVREGAGQLGLDIRAGVHSGEVERRDGDVRGIAVHIGQRISALAQPSEVLVSSTVKDLVAGSGIEFTDRGSHALKGLPDEWRVYAAT